MHPDPSASSVIAKPPLEHPQRKPALSASFEFITCAANGGCIHSLFFSLHSVRT